MLVSLSQMKSGQWQPAERPFSHHPERHKVPLTHLERGSSALVLWAACLGKAPQSTPKVTFLLHGIAGSIPLSPAWGRNAMTLKEQNKPEGGRGGDL